MNILLFWLGTAVLAMGLVGLVVAWIKEARFERRCEQEMNELFDDILKRGAS